MLIGVLVNTVAILVCGVLGSRVGQSIPERHSDLVMVGLKITVFSLGISFAIKTSNLLIVIVSIVIGSLIGETIDIDQKMKRFSDWVTAKLKAGDMNENKFSTAFVTASLVYCVGSMAILAALESGIEGSHTIHYTKAIIDGVASLFFAATLGVGVAASALVVLVYQGGLTILASMISPYVTPEIITEVSATGGIMLIALSMSMLEIIKVKVANMSPALIIPVIILSVMQLL